MKLFAFAKQKVVTFLQKVQEGDMPFIECTTCHKRISISTTVDPSATEIEFLGSITCKKEGVIEEHSFPIKFNAGRGRGSDIGILPAPHSVEALSAKVESAGDATVKAVLEEKHREDLVQDITEACSAKLWELYKSSVVMCRRIVQIPLTERLMALKKDDKANPIWANRKLDNLTLGPLLDIERKLEPHLLSGYQYEQANKIREAGNDGAHKRAELEPDSVDGNIREAAIIAASLVYQMEMQASASQSEKGAGSILE